MIDILISLCSLFPEFPALLEEASSRRSPLMVPEFPKVGRPFGVPVLAPRIKKNYRKSLKISGFYSIFAVFIQLFNELPIVFNPTPYKPLVWFFGGIPPV